MAQESRQMASEMRDGFRTGRHAVVRTLEIHAGLLVLERQGDTKRLQIAEQPVSEVVATDHITPPAELDRTAQPANPVEAFEHSYNFV